MPKAKVKTPNPIFFYFKHAVLGLKKEIQQKFKVWHVSANATNVSRIKATF
jgi:hypothetical protein